jgi:tetratricopeptide (TPR) repeat protein
MKPRGRIWAVAVLGAALAVTARPTRADDVDALVKQGVEFRRQGREKDALEVFRRAAAIKATPRVLAQMAFAEQALGQWIEAEAHVKSALENKNDRWIEKNTAVIEGALKNIESHLGTLEIWGTPAGAEVLVDGQSMGTLPSSGALRRPIGEVTVTVRQPGYVEATRVLQVQRGGLVRENIDLHPLPPRPPAAQDPQAGEGAASTSGSAVSLERAPSADHSDASDTDGGGEVRRPIYERWWFWTLVGAVAIGAGAGAYVLTRHDGTTMTCDMGVHCGTWAATSVAGGLTKY